MTVVADTSVLVDHLRDHLPAVALLRGAVDRGDDLAASVLTRVEILAGMRSGERRRTEALFRLLRWVAVDEDVADRAGALAREHRRSSPGVDPVDYVVAATAQLVGAELWTRNVRHFPMFEGLRAPYC